MAKIFTIILFVKCTLSIAQLAKIEIILPDSNIVFTKDSTQKVIFGKNFRQRIERRKGEFIVRNPREIYIKGKKITYKPYVPTIDEVNSFDFLLLNHVSSAPDSLVTKNEKDHIKNKYTNYTFQYLGYIDKNGDVIIHINCLIRNSELIEERWKESLIIMNDGGPNYFNIKYNKTKKLFFDLYINGKA